VTLLTIPERLRRTEDELWAAYFTMQPRLLGALLDAVAGALRDLPTVRLAGLPRMADFAAFATAAEGALGWQPGSFLRAYRSNRDSSTEMTLEASPVAIALQTLVATAPSPANSYFEGTASDLLQKLVGVSGDVVRAKGWPTDARRLSGALRRLAPMLRAIGISITFDRDATTKQRKRLVFVRPVPIEPELGREMRPDRPMRPHGTQIANPSETPTVRTPPDAEDADSASCSDTRTPDATTRCRFCDEPTHYAANDGWECPPGRGCAQGG
jgi:hypothetical protein